MESTNKTRYFTMLKDFSAVLNFRTGTLLFFVMITINSCGGGSSAPQAVVEEANDENITSKIVLHDAGVSYYDNANYKNIRLSSDDTYLYAIETKSNDANQNIIYFEYNASSDTYEFRGDAYTDAAAAGIANFELSNDGRHLYAVSENEISVFTRNLTNGLLNIQSNIQRAEISDNFFPGKIGVVSSGLFIFVSNIVDNKIAIFIRDPSSGNLNLSDIQKPNGDQLITKFLPSPNNNHLYLLFNRSIMTAAINSASGSLVFSQEFTSGVGLSNQLTSFNSLQDAVLIDNDALVFLANSNFLSTDDSHSAFKSLVVTERDPVSGNISYVKSIDLAASTVAAHVRGAIINSPVSELSYVLLETENEGQTSTNHLIKLQGSPLSAEFSVFTSSPIYEIDIYGYLAGTIKSDGSKLIFAQAQNEGGSISEMNLDDTPTNNNIVNKLLPYANRIEGLNTVAHVVTSHDGKNAYAFTNTLDPIITSYQFDNNTGNLTYLNTLNLRSSQFLPEFRFLKLGSFLPTDVILDSAVISPDDKHLFLLASNKIICLQRDVNTGGLTRLATVEAGIFSLWDANGPNIPVSDVTFFESSFPGFVAEGITVSPDGNYLYISGLTQNDDTALAILSRNSGTGELQLVGILDTSLPAGEKYSFPRGPLLSRITNNGEYLYFSNQNMALLLEFRLNTSTGLVESISAVQDGMVDSNNRVFEGLLNISAIRFSSDDRFIYLASDDIYSGYSLNIVSLQVLERLPNNGGLKILQVIKRSNLNIMQGDLFPPAIIQGGARTIEISDDNKHLYMLTQKTLSFSMRADGYSLDVFEIDQYTGRVQLVQRHKSDVAGLGISSIKTIPGNNYVIAANDRNGSIGILSK